jgi:hypothetical protein
MTSWLDLLNSIPGAAKAVADLVGEIGRAGAGLVRIGTATTNQVVQGIEDDTRARSELADALTDAAKQYIQANATQLGERALTHGINKIVRQQVNREAVTVMALEDLRDDPPKDIPKDTPSDDWLNLFGSYAERASSEAMRRHWAQILSGEIRRPGSFGMATLQMASVLDQNLAKTIEEVAPWIVDDSFIPTVEELNRGPFYSKMLTLDGIGFLRVGAGSRYHTTTPQGHIYIPLKNKIITGVGPPNKEITIRATFLTRSGIELLKILAYDSCDGLLALMTKVLKQKGIEKIQVRPTGGK